MSMNTIEKAMQKLKSAHKQSESAENFAVIEPTGDLHPTKDEHRSDASSSGAHMDCQLDFQDLNRRGFLTPEIPNETLAEEYRVIKRPLLMNALGRGAEIIHNANLIVVTSAMPGEGKTYTALNLAMSIAMEKDTRVLLVDCDVIKPSMTDIFGLAEVPGLTDMLSGEGVGVPDILYKTNVTRLNIIPAGKRYSHDAELLSSIKMKKLTEELSVRYPDRMVIFDAPPLLATSHARVMTHYAGQLVLVVEAGKTLEFSIKDAVSQIGDDKIVGVVLNKGRGTFNSSYYGSYGTRAE